MKYERRWLRQPWRRFGRAARVSEDQVGTVAPGCPPGRSSALSFSGSAVVAILFKVACPQTFRGQERPRHTYLDADAEDSRRLSHNVNRTSNDHQTAGSSNVSRPAQGGRYIPGLLNIRARGHTRRCLPDLVRPRRTWVVGL